MVTIPAALFAPTYSFIRVVMSSRCLPFMPAACGSGFVHATESSAPRRERMPAKTRIPVQVRCFLINLLDYPTRTGSLYVRSPQCEFGVPSAGLGHLTLWANGTSQPLASTLNAIDGAITSNIAFVPSSNSFIDAYATKTLT